MSWFDIYARLYDPFMKIFGFCRIKKIMQVLELKHDDKVLDIAGGTGFIASKLKPFVKEITVLDTSKNMLKQAEKKNLKTCSGNALELPFEDGSFSIILCIDALHHIKKHDWALKEMHRVLGKNGRLFIMEFEIKGFRGKIIEFLEKTFAGDTKFISSQELLAKTKPLGFEGRVIPSGRKQYIYSGVKRS